MTETAAPLPPSAQPATGLPETGLPETGLPETGLGDSAALAAALAHLARTIDARADGADGASDTTSWTARLLAAGPRQCAKKLGEEAVELVIALASQGEDAVAAEAADALYHLMVALRSRGVSLAAVADVLAARQGASGLEEKARRG